MIWEYGDGAAGISISVKLDRRAAFRSELAAFPVPPVAVSLGSSSASSPDQITWGARHLGGESSTLGDTDTPSKMK